METVHRIKHAQTIAPLAVNTLTFAHVRIYVMKQTPLPTRWPVCVSERTGKKKKKKDGTRACGRINGHVRECAYPQE